MSVTLGYDLFPTALGYCGVTRSERGLTGVQLPTVDESASRASMSLRFANCSESVPPSHVQEAIVAVTALLLGTPPESADLTHLVLDMDDVPPFHQRV